MTEPEELRAAAQRYREIGKRIPDPRTIDALAELAQEYERRNRAKGLRRSELAGIPAQDDAAIRRLLPAISLPTCHLR